VATKKKDKIELLWQDFEKSGSVEAYLNFHQIRAKKTPKAKSNPKSKR
jgi:hypothetical protein